MTTYEVRVGLVITPEHDGDDVDAFTDRLVDELCRLTDEADLGGSVTSGNFRISVVVDAEAPFDALRKGCVLIKTATHAAGGYTGALTVPEEWPDWMHEVSLAAEPVPSDDCVPA